MTVTHDPHTARNAVGSSPVDDPAVWTEALEALARDREVDELRDFLIAATGGPYVPDYVPLPRLVQE